MTLYCIRVHKRDGWKVLSILKRYVIKLNLNLFEHYTVLRPQNQVSSRENYWNRIVRWLKLAKQILIPQSASNDLLYSQFEEKVSKSRRRCILGLVTCNSSTYVNKIQRIRQGIHIINNFEDSRGRYPRFDSHCRQHRKHLARSNFVRK